MKAKSIENFNKEREELNELVLKYAGKTTRRFFSLDSQAYRKGELDEKTKEMLGLVASIVLRCDDCISYHIIQCFKKSVSIKEFDEIFSIAMVVGGSITIPHIRRAVKTMDELFKE